MILCHWCSFLFSFSSFNTSFQDPPNVLLCPDSLMGSTCLWKHPVSLEVLEPVYFYPRIKWETVVCRAGRTWGPLLCREEPSISKERVCKRSLKRTSPGNGGPHSCMHFIYATFVGSLPWASSKLRAPHPEINLVSPYPPAAYSPGEEIGRSIEGAVRFDKAKAEVSVRFGPQGRSCEVVMENFLEARMPF